MFVVTKEKAAVAKGNYRRGRKMAKLQRMSSAHAQPCLRPKGNYRWGRKMAKLQRTSSAHAQPCLRPRKVVSRTQQCLALILCELQ